MTSSLKLLDASAIAIKTVKMMDEGPSTILSFGDAAIMARRHYSETFANQDVDINKIYASPIDFLKREDVNQRVFHFVQAVWTNPQEWAIDGNEYSSR